MQKKTHKINFASQPFEKFHNLGNKSITILAVTPLFRDTTVTRFLEFFHSCVAKIYLFFMNHWAWNSTTVDTLFKLMRVSTYVVICLMYPTYLYCFCFWQCQDNILSGLSLLTPWGAAGHITSWTFLRINSAHASFLCPNIALEYFVLSIGVIHKLSLQNLDLSDTLTSWLAVFFSEICKIYLETLTF